MNNKRETETRRKNKVISKKALRTVFAVLLGLVCAGPVWTAPGNDFSYLAVETLERLNPLFRKMGSMHAEKDGESFAAIAPQVISAFSQVPWREKSAKRVARIVDLLNNVLLNIGKKVVDGSIHPAYFSFQLADYHFWILYHCETGKPNPKAGFLFDSVEFFLTQCGICIDNLLSKDGCPPEKAKLYLVYLRSHLRACERFIAEMEFPAAYQSLVRQFQTASRRLQFSLAHGERSDYVKEFQTLCAVERRLKGVAAVTANCSYYRRMDSKL